MGESSVIQGLKAHIFASVAELVDALDLGSSVLGCESSSLSTRTILSSLIKRKIHAGFHRIEHRSRASA